MACLLCFGFWQLGQGRYIPAKAWMAQVLMQNAWVRSNESGSDQKPWPWADTWPVARLTARSKEIDLIVLAGGQGRTLAFGPGHLSASASPGDTGNSVIAGHRDTHFRFLRDVRAGELFSVETTDGRKFEYEVVATEVVDSRIGRLRLDTDAAILSLVTCYPFDTNSSGGPLRYVVTASRVY